MQQPLLIVISGPSGSGKDSVLRQLNARDSSLHFVVTVTSRPPRPDEVDGVDYVFVSPDEFDKMIEQDELLEHAVVYGQQKGIPKDQVQRAMASGKDVVMRIDVQGAATVRSLYPNALLIFLTIPDAGETVKRLTARQTDDSQAIDLRAAIAPQELQRLDEFDYAVVNQDGHLEDTVDTILAIIHAEHHRIRPRKVNL